MNRIIAVFGTLIALAVVAYLFLDLGYIRLNYPAPDKYPVRGIDVSHHQDVIDWHLLTREGLKFVFIKATEGGDHKDTRFVRNWEMAEKAGLARGAYHFFTFCKPGREQAMNFMETVPVEDDMLPPVIDLEFGGNCSARPTREEVHDEVEDFARLVRRKYGMNPIIYATSQSYADFLEGRDYAYPLWIRNIYRTPYLADGKKWDFWQYANRGRLQGIKGFVDLNVFNGTEEEFEEFLDSGGQRVSAESP